MLKKNIFSFKSLILLITVLASVYIVLFYDSFYSLGHVFTLLFVLVLPAFILFVTDITEQTFKDKITTIFVFAALAPIAFGPILDLLQKSSHVYFLYSLLAFSMVSFLFIYMFGYIKWIFQISYFLLLIFLFVLLYLSTLFVFVDIFCEKDELKYDQKFCVWVSDTIKKEESGRGDL